MIKIYGIDDVGLKIFLKNFGCSLNFADGEVIAGCLKEVGYGIVGDVDEADIAIYNTCAVKGPTEDKIINALKSIAPNKKLIVTGCLPLINFERLEKEVRFDGAIGPAPAFEIVKAVEEATKGRKLLSLRNDFKPPLSSPRIPTSSVIRIMPIAYGCLGNCSYCCVRFARGRLRSYPIEEVKEAVKKALADGASEIWLTAQDSACYGRDIETDLPSLLNSVNEIDGKFFIRLGMMCPNTALEILDDLIEAYKDEKVFKFLHIPVQSGDDDVLASMNRRYTTEEFKYIVRRFREAIPQITIVTDFICGFPGESERAFGNSLALIRELKPDIVNVSKFFPRPKTPAKKLEQLPSLKIKERSKEMTLLARRMSLENNKRWIGWEGEILIDEKGKLGSWIGRNFAYKPIVVESKERLMGKRLRIRVKEACFTYLKADILD